MSENACKVESTVGASTTDTANNKGVSDSARRVMRLPAVVLTSRSSQLEKAKALRAFERRFRVGSIPTSGIVPVEHGWFMHRPCKSGCPDSNSGTGLSAEGKLRGGYITMPLDGRGCTNQTIWTRSSTEERRSSKPEVCGFNSHRVRNSFIGVVDIRKCFK